MDIHRKRRLIFTTLLSLCFLVFGLFLQVDENQKQTIKKPVNHNKNTTLATNALNDLDIKGRAPKTGYDREEFGGGWQKNGNCDTRNDILARDLKNIKIVDCKVYGGVLHDPYTGKTINFSRGPTTSSLVQIDHVVALSDAWKKGAQYLDSNTREELANDPLGLLAVDGKTNENKGDGDAATWLPPNKSYRCRYIARQIAVKRKYDLWVTKAEYNAMDRVLSSCPGQVLPIIQL